MNPNGPPVQTILNSNIASMLVQAAERHGERTAVIDADMLTTWAALAGRAAGIAASLSDLQVSSHDRVGVLLDRNADAAAAFYGITAAGGIAVNLSETLRPRQIEHILENAGVKVLLTTPEQLGRLPRALQTNVTIVDVEVLPRAENLVPCEAVGTDAAQIIYTSGSTGQPKGVVISHGNLWAVMHATTSYLGIVAGDRIASLLPFSYTYGFNQLLCATGTGASLVIERSPLADQIVSTLGEQQVTVLPAVPPLWLQLLRVPAFRANRLAALRVMTNAGGRLPVEAVRSLREVQPDARLFLMYGMTETLRATYLPPEDVDAHPDSIGRAIPGAEILILRDDGSPCDTDEEGELVQRGPTVGLGYWGDPEATARVFRPNPLRPAGMPDTERVVFSGDLVRRDRDGFLYHVGRRDKMIKSLGYRVSPDEIVDTLHASKLVAEVIVTTEPDPQRGVRIVAYAVLSEGSTREQLVAFCRIELPRYQQPSRIEIRDQLPRTASGKHDLEAVKVTPVSA